jgi:hypothetical protein
MTFAPTIFQIGNSTGNFTEYMEKAPKMVAAKDSLQKLVFDTGFFNCWSPNCEYAPPSTYRELKTIVVIIRPEIRKDYTAYQSEFWGNYESVEKPIYGLADWLWENRCPNLQTIRIDWDTNTQVSWCYYDGDYDYDRYGRYSESSYDDEDEPLDPNIVMERFFAELNLDFCWITQHGINFVLPPCLIANSCYPGCCKMTPNPLEEGKARDEAAFDAILEEYKASRNYY